MYSIQETSLGSGNDYYDEECVSVSDTQLRECCGRNQFNKELTVYILTLPRRKGAMRKGVILIYFKVVLLHRILFVLYCLNLTRRNKVK